MEKNTASYPASTIEGNHTVLRAVLKMIRHHGSLIERSKMEKQMKKN